jgi:hypothetical protein
MYNRYKLKEEKSSENEIVYRNAYKKIYRLCA